MEREMRFRRARARERKRDEKGNEIRTQQLQKSSQAKRPTRVLLDWPREKSTVPIYVCKSRELKRHAPTSEFSIRTRAPLQLFD